MAAAASTSVNTAIHQSVKLLRLVASPNPIGFSFFLSPSVFLFLGVSGCLSVGITSLFGSLIVDTCWFAFWRECCRLRLYLPLLMLATWQSKIPGQFRVRTFRG